MLSAKHIGQEELLFEDFKLISLSTADKCWRRCKPEKRDILVVSRGGGIGRTIISGHTGYCLMGSVLLFKPSILFDEHFLTFYLQSPIGNTRLRDTSGFSAQQAIYITHLQRDYLIPVASLSEQRRIVAKVDQLMALCDKLEAKLTHAQDKSEALMGAVVHGLLAG